MARTVAQVKQQMIDQKNAEAALAGLTSTSQSAMWNLYIFLVASAVVIFEQILDAFKVSVEQIAYEAKPSTPQYVRKKVLEFQYDADTPQVAQLNTDLTISYPLIVEQFRILTRCAVVTTVNRTVLIKVAKSEPPEPIDSSEKTALIDYIAIFDCAGIAFSVISAYSDKAEVAGEVFYDGQYNAVMATNVKAAITAYLKAIDFDMGLFSVQALTDAVQSVPGVIDFRLDAIKIRQNTAAYVDGTDVYNLANGINLVTYLAYAGYIEEETGSGHTFTDTLIFTAQ